jgi:hypothetical protein
MPPQWWYLADNVAALQLICYYCHERLWNNLASRKHKTCITLFSISTHSPTFLYLVLCVMWNYKAIDMSERLHSHEELFMIQAWWGNAQHTWKNWALPFKAVEKSSQYDTNHKREWPRTLSTKRSNFSQNTNHNYEHIHKSTAHGKKRVKTIACHNEEITEITYN